MDVKAIHELQRLGRQMLTDGLVWGNGGNISVRTGPESFLITGSGASLGDLQDSDFVECSLSGEVLRAAGRRPSKEAPMHGAVYAARPDVNAVVHSHPFYGLLMAVSCEEVPASWFVENMYYLERVARVPYHHPGSKELAEAVGANAQKANLLILDNHGILALDTNLSEAYTAMQTFEITSRLYVASKAAGIAVPGLSPELVAEFLRESGYKPRREWPRA